MDKRIIFINEDNTIGIIIPADCGLTIEEIAAELLGRHGHGNSN